MVRWWTNPRECRLYLGKSSFRQSKLGTPHCGVEPLRRALRNSSPGIQCRLNVPFGLRAGSEPVKDFRVAGAEPGEPLHAPLRGCSLTRVNMALDPGQLAAIPERAPHPSQSRNQGKKAYPDHGDRDRPSSLSKSL